MAAQDEARVDALPGRGLVVWAATDRMVGALKHTLKLLGGGLPPVDIFLEASCVAEKATESVCKFRTTPTALPPSSPPCMVLKQMATPGTPYFVHSGEGGKEAPWGGGIRDVQ